MRKFDPADFLVLGFDRRAAVKLAAVSCSEKAIDALYNIAFDEGDGYEGWVRELGGDVEIDRSSHWIGGLVGGDISDRADITVIGPNGDRLYIGRLY